MTRHSAVRAAFLAPFDTAWPFVLFGISSVLPLLMLFRATPTFGGLPWTSDDVVAHLMTTVRLVGPLAILAFAFADARAPDLEPRAWLPRHIGRTGFFAATIAGGAFTGSIVALLLLVPRGFAGLGDLVMGVLLASVWLGIWTGLARMCLALFHTMADRQAALIGVWLAAIPVAAIVSTFAVNAAFYATTPLGAATPAAYGLLPLLDTSRVMETVAGMTFLPHLDPPLLARAYPAVHHVGAYMLALVVWLIGPVWISTRARRKTSAAKDEEVTA